MKRICIILFCTNIVLSNAQKPSNPIFFTDGFVGFADGNSKGFVANFGLNYQIKDDLFSIRYSELMHLRYEGIFIIIPIYKEIENIQETGILYGKRIIEDNVSYSISGGISYINRNHLVEENISSDIFENQKSIGFPFEMNIKFFNRNKERYRIYFLIPVGRPTAFGRSFGLKVIGNVSKSSFIGFGITYGFGFHKNY